MKKFLTTLLLSTFFIIPKNTPEIIIPKLPKTYQKFEPELKIENEYLKTKTKKFFENIDENYLKKNISEELKNKEHSSRKNDPYSKYNYPEDIISQIDSLSNDQLQIIYLMKENLKEKEFRKKIGTIIKKDIKDKGSGHGGIIKLNLEGKLELINLQSDLIKSKKFDSFYLMPKLNDSVKYLAEFHLHSSEYNESDFASPSSTDIIINEARLYKLDFSHEFLITSLKKGKFNIDYYGITKEGNKKSKIIDLGNYEY